MAANRDKFKLKISSNWKMSRYFPEFHLKTKHCNMHTESTELPLSCYNTLNSSTIGKLHLRNECIGKLHFHNEG